jgi:DNA-binding Lrp family transcriptional regulator
MIEDAEIIRKNCQEYASTNGKAIEVLKKANGKIDYKKIANILGMHPTAVSSLLRKSAKLGLSKKEGEFYHKLPGILGYLSKTARKKVPTKTHDLKEVSLKALKASKSTKQVYNISSVSNSEKMAESYVWLYVTENSLRQFIRNILGRTETWWKTKVNQSIQKVVEDEMKRYPYDGAKRNDELEYTHLGQLKEIIVSNQNWNLFKGHLREKDKTKFQVIVDKAIPTRNSIGHCISLKGIDLKEVEVRFRDILKMIK